jgi:hypothetical protein
VLRLHGEICGFKDALKFQAYVIKDVVKNKFINSNAYNCSSIHNSYIVEHNHRCSIGGDYNIGGNLSTFTI